MRKLICARFPVDRRSLSGLIKKLLIDYCHEQGIEIGKPKRAKKREP
jgi:hypothetical protein